MTDCNIAFSALGKQYNVFLYSGATGPYVSVGIDGRNVGVLKSAVERFPDGGTLVYLVDCPSVCGAAESPQAALQNLMEYCVAEEAHLGKQIYDDLAVQDIQRYRILSGMLGK